MFPVTDSSQTIIDCLTREAARLGVRVRTGCGVAEVLKKDQALNVFLTEDGTVECDCLLLATGGSRGLKGHGLADRSATPSRRPCLRCSLFTWTIRVCARWPASRRPTRA